MIGSSLTFLISRRGQPATLVSKLSNSYDPDTGINSPTTDPKEIIAYFGSSKLGHKVDGSATVGSRYVAFSGSLGVVPKVGDIIEGVSDKVVVSEIQTIYNGSNSVCYICYSKE